MVSPWGRKKDVEQQQSGGQEGVGEASQGGSDAPRRSEEVTERTHLLPPRERPVQGYLDPDDPAVTPYNLWSVRALRYFTVIFLAITFIWWVLLLVAIFFTPPGMNTRGSGFFDFSFTTLAAGYLLTALIFFSVPSRAFEVTSLLLALLLLVSTVVILSSHRLRVEEGWVGIVSAAWATVMVVYNILADKAVAWGKREEEERLTGRQETRRTLREWCAVLTYTTIMVIYIIIAILLTGTLCIRAQDATLGPPGERYLVNGNRYEVHLYCAGNRTSSDTPLVLLEGGELPVANSLESWAYTAHVNNSIPRYCYWDRPGFGWSDTAPSPFSAGMAADSLSEALALAGEEPPYILVSAGIGGIYSRIFSSRHGDDIQGILLIDTLHEDLLHRISKASRGFIIWGQGIISPLGLPQLFGAIFQGRTREDRIYGRQSIYSGRFLKAILQENLAADVLTRSEINAARKIQDVSTPLVVVSSGVECHRDREWCEKQEALSKVTDNLISWDKVKGAKHEVWKNENGARILSQRVGELVKLAKHD